MSSDDSSAYHKNNYHQKYQSHTEQSSSTFSHVGSSNSRSNSESVPQGPPNHHYQQTGAKQSMLPSSTTSNISAQQTPTSINDGSLLSFTSNTANRRRSSLTYQQQLLTAVAAVAAASEDSMDIGDTGVNGPNPSSFTSPSRYSPHPNEGGFHHIGSKLSIHPTDVRYEDSITCCLPPPSPAPTCDRFIMSIPSPSSSVSSNSHFTDSQPSSVIVGGSQQSSQQQPSVTANLSHKYGVGINSSLQRSMSPNSRFRMVDRFREISPKCDRFVTSTHFLANSTPLVSSDAYTYLSSTVHTPVKRYVPTPPPPSEIYPENPHHPASTSSASSTAGSYHTLVKSPNLPHQQLQIQSSSQQQQPSHHPNVSTLPYRFRMKCCISDQPVQSNLSNVSQNTPHHDRLSNADHYATSPRVRAGFKCSAASDELSIDPPSQRHSVSNYQQQTSSVPSNGGLRTPRNTSCILNDFVSRTPSIEYIGSTVGRVVTPVSILSEPSAGTCLHCNTMRRTTGVHQTTQTTGPVSPVPLQNLPEGSASAESATSNEQTSSTSTPSTSESHISPLSPSLHHQQQQSQQIQPKEDEIMCIEQQRQSQSYSNRSFPKQQPDQHEELQLFKEVHDQPQELLHDQPPHYLQQPPQYQHQHQPPQQYHQQQLSQNRSTHIVASGNITGAGVSGNHNSLNTRQQLQHRFTRKQRLNQYVRKEIAKFFGVDTQSENDERTKWTGRQRRFAIRRFGSLKSENELNGNSGRRHNASQQPPTERPDILPAHTEESQVQSHIDMADFHHGQHVERKASVPTMIIAGLSYIVQTLNKRQHRYQRQWSRSFAPAHVTAINGDNPSDICEGLTALQEEDVFFDSPGNDAANLNVANGRSTNAKIIEHQRQIYMGERVHGWRTSAIIDQQHTQQQQQQIHGCNSGHLNSIGNAIGVQQRTSSRGTRISSQLLDGVLENSRRPVARKVKLFSVQDLDDRNDHRPFFTYWINTVQILVLTLSLICYGIGPIGFGVEQKTGQVLVTSLSLQTVQHHEQRNVWIGPKNSDLVHMGAKFATCMRRDIKIMDVISKTRRQERETACCIRNDDSGCVQSSQADCSVRGLFPTKSISTWKKWSPGESGPGGRISGSVCGLDPKFCDAPASIAPYEWPDDITKWPICRKTNSFSQRFRFKDHTAEHMVCEVIGHPCCTGVFGECRITTREYCDFVNGYFHEEASLCSQISCLNNVCGMFPFFSIEVPDQFYRLFTSLCLHAGILHLAITIAFQHVFLADLERLIGPIRTAIVYIGSGLAGNLTSAVLVPYKPEVGPLASLAGVIASLVVLLILIHWKQLRKPHIALFKLIVIGGILFGIGTLPWQLNFAGLLAGILCGIFLTIALVPFVSITKYGRKTKINLIWTCILFHLFIYTVMFIIFYLYPTELTSFNFGDVISSGFNSNGGGIDSFRNMHATPSNNHHQQQQQHHHHHHSDDIITNTVLSGLSSGDNSALHYQQHISQSQQQSYYHRMFNSNYYNLTNVNNYNNNNNRSNSKNSKVNTNLILHLQTLSRHKSACNNKNRSNASYQLQRQRQELQQQQQQHKFLASSDILTIGRRKSSDEEKNFSSNSRSKVSSESYGDMSQLKGDDNGIQIKDDLMTKSLQFSDEENSIVYDHLTATTSDTFAATIVSSATSASLLSPLPTTVSMMTQKGTISTSNGSNAKTRNNNNRHRNIINA